MNKKTWHTFQIVTRVVQYTVYGHKAMMRPHIQTDFSLKLSQHREEISLNLLI